MNHFHIIEHNNGTILIITLLTLFVLSLAGIMAINTAKIETQISGNLRNYKENFYKTESAVREIAISIENTTANNLINGNKIVLPDQTDIQLSNAGNLINQEATLSLRLQIANNPLANITQDEPIYNNKVLVVHGGPAPGSSMTIGYSHAASAKHRFFVYGNARQGTTLGKGVLIEIGYLKRIQF